MKTFIFFINLVFIAAGQHPLSDEVRSKIVVNLKFMKNLTKKNDFYR